MHCPDQDIDPELTIAEFLAASVDAVKDPVLNFLNINTITAHAACLLGRLGYSVDDISLLLNQPIIRELCTVMFENDITDVSQGAKELYSQLQYKSDNRDVLNISVPQYQLKFGEGEADNEMAEDNLMYNIIRATQSKEGTASDWKGDDEFLQLQFKILNEFQKINRAAKSLNSLVGSSKFTSSNGVGSTLGALYQQQMKTEKFNNEFKDEEG